MGTIILIFYLLGVLVSTYFCWKIVKKSKPGVLEIVMCIYLALISWIGFFTLVAGRLAGFNDDNDNF